MTKWKQRRRERQQIVRDVALASAPVFLQMILEQALKHRASEKDTKDLRLTACEAAWAHGEMMARVRP